jgi:type I restriction enzyme, R subunit
MAAKEAKARIKLNKLLEEAGWRFFDESKGKANIVLEPKVKLTKAAVDALGENFETTSNGFIDFLLLDWLCQPLVVVERKPARINACIEIF